MRMHYHGQTVRSGAWEMRAAMRQIDEDLTAISLELGRRMKRIEARLERLEQPPAGARPEADR